MSSIWKVLKKLTISVVHTYSFRQLEWKNHLLYATSPRLAISEPMTARIPSYVNVNVNVNINGAKKKEAREGVQRERERSTPRT